MIRKIKWLFLFLLFCKSYNTQSAAGNDKISYQKQTRVIMAKQIRKLKDGVLLVRLHSRSNAIKALKELGRKEEADELNDKQVVFNKKIIAAFKANFTFCPVYFFYSTSSDSVVLGLADKIIFLNSDLQPDPSIKMAGPEFLTAEFGDIEPDTLKYFSQNYLYSGENGIEKRSAYGGGPDTGLKGLRIMSDRLIQLKRPFPYYVRSYREFPNTKKVNKTILKMNKKLFAYYVLTKSVK